MERQIGRVTHYYGHLGVAILRRRGFMRKRIRQMEAAT